MKTGDCFWDLMEKMTFPRARMRQDVLDEASDSDREGTVDAVLNKSCGLGHEIMRVESLTSCPWSLSIPDLLYIMSFLGDISAAVSAWSCCSRLFRSSRCSRCSNWFCPSLCSRSF